MREETARLEDTNARLQSEVNSLRSRLSQADRSLLTAAESKAQDDVMGRRELQNLERSLEEAKEENNKRIAETSQFQQMRKLMQSQSAKIRDLRRRLERYEPDSVKEDDGMDGI
jgi:chromosome segregation ATPase